MAPMSSNIRRSAAKPIVSRRRSASRTSPRCPGSSSGPWSSADLSVWRWCQQQTLAEHHRRPPQPAPTPRPGTRRSRFREPIRRLETEGKPPTRQRPGLSQRVTFSLDRPTVLWWRFREEPGPLCGSLSMVLKRKTTLPDQRPSDTRCASPRHDLGVWYSCWPNHTSLAIIFDYCRDRCSWLKTFHHDGYRCDRPPDGPRPSPGIVRDGVHAPLDLSHSGSNTLVYWYILSSKAASAVKEARPPGQPEGLLPAAALPDDPPADARGP